MSSLIEEVKLRVSYENAPTYLILLLPAMIALSASWFATSWDKIPWFDSWIWWSRGYSVSLVGRFWDPGYLAYGNSPFVSALLASIFSIAPSKLATILFMKLFSFFFVYFISLEVYFLSRMILRRISVISDRDKSLVAALSSIIIMSNSWELFYATTFVQELLGIPILLGAIMLLWSNAERKLVQILAGLFMLASVLFVSPFTALFGMVYFLIGVATLVWYLGPRYSMRRLFTVLLAISLPIIALGVFIWRYPISPNSSSLLGYFVLKPLPVGFFTYGIISSGGLVTWALAVIGFVGLVYFATTNRFTLRQVIFLGTLFLFPIFFGIEGFFYRMALYSGLAVSILAAAGITFILVRVGRFESGKVNLGRKSWTTLFMLMILFSQTSYAMNHASQIDRSNESQVVGVLTNLAKSIPLNATVVPDASLVDKALGILAPRVVYTWGYVSEYQNATTSEEEMLKLASFVVEKQVYFIDVMGSGSFVDRLFTAILSDASTIVSSYNLNIFYTGNASMLTYGERSIYVFTFSTLTQSSSHALVVPTANFTVQQNLSSTNVKNVSILASSSSTRLAYSTADNSSAWVWVTTRLTAPVSLADYEFAIVTLRLGNDALVNMAFGNSTQTDQVHAHDMQAPGGTSIFLLNSSLSFAQGIGLGDNFNYVWLALAGQGSSGYSMVLYSFVLIPPVMSSGM
ncbi:MAG: hypothetical protein ACLP9K_08825 [Nitrososphaerales archaeon]